MSCTSQSTLRSLPSNRSVGTPHAPISSSIYDSLLYYDLSGQFVTHARRVRGSMFPAVPLHELA